MRVRRYLIVCLSVVILAVACGGEDEVASTGEPSLEDYVANLEALREGSRSEIKLLTTEVPTVEPSAQEDRVLIFYRRLLAAMRDGIAGFFDGMREITPPDEIEMEHQAVLSASVKYQAGLDALVRHVEEAYSIESMERFLPSNEGADSLRRARLELQEAIRNHGFELDFNCEYASGPGGLCFLASPAEQYCDTSGVFGEPDCETTDAGTVCTGCVGIGGFAPGTPPSDFQTPIGCDEPSDGIGGETIDFGGIHGNTDAPIPPLPPNLFAVSDYIDSNSRTKGHPILEDL